MANGITIRAAARLAGLFETPPINIVKPTVIEAPQAAVFDPTVAQIRAPMRTVNSQQSHAILFIAEQNQIFAENFNAERRAPRR
jgi:hypothetical protein